MAELNTSESPEVFNPELHRRLSGDWSDDDGQAIDDQFELAFNGPVESESLAAAKDSVPTATRILSRAIQIGTVDTVLRDPVQVFPADLSRKRLIIQADGDVVIGSDKTDVYGNVAIQTPTQWAADQHTGALWIYSTAATPVNVCVWSITS